MNENQQAIAYLNGRICLEADAALHVFDLGVVGGYAVSEMLRTFGHRVYEQRAHLARLQRSLTSVGLELPVDIAKLEEIIASVVTHNARLVHSATDLGVIVFVTAGLNPTYVGTQSAGSGPTLGVHTFRLPFGRWARRYSAGQALRLSAHQAIPADVIDPAIKCRSRLHWYLADREVRQIEPDAMALLRNSAGEITETSTGNVCVIHGKHVFTPPADEVLSGISLQAALRLAGEMGLRTEAKRLTPEDVANADEVWLTSTPHCALPVTRFEGQQIALGTPGPMYERLMTAWSHAVGLNVIDQMQSFAEPEERG